MIDPWWRATTENIHSKMIRGLGPTGIIPELADGRSNALQLKMLDRVGAYTWEWTNEPDDPGTVLVRLISFQLEMAFHRLNRLPEKAFNEYLRIGGVTPRLPTGASALIEFIVSDAAPQSILIPEGFQVGAPPATEGADRVVFETNRNFFAAPATISKLYVREEGFFRDVSDANENIEQPFQPFGRDAEAGRALLIGLDSGEVTPGPQISLGIIIQSPPGAPPPIGDGGIAPLPVPPPPMLQWEVYSEGSWQRVEVIRDGTSRFGRSGIVELGLPRIWKQAQPGGLDNLRWIRVRIVQGRFAATPVLRFVHLNMIEASAARTVQNEALTDITDPLQQNGRRMRLRETPVIPDSLELMVDNEKWRRVDDLFRYGGDEKIYQLDPDTGVITFGDGINGARPPTGFRNMVAQRYQVGGGEAGRVEADEITTLLMSIPFISEATNPLPATGGQNTESYAEIIERGPSVLRARDRAVTSSDYALMALQADGAEVARAFAVAGHHPQYSGRPVPGVVAVFVVPPDRGEGPPIPDEATLQAVAKFLSRKAAPAGVEVVAAAPKYQRIRVEAMVELDPQADTGATVQSVLKELNEYFHPIEGGEDGQGWPHGEPVYHNAVVRRILTRVKNVRAVPNLALVIDGLRLDRCQDAFIPYLALLWPDLHEVVPTYTGRTQ
jgi:predicted phage baseplate assembly protein